MKKLSIGVAVAALFVVSGCNAGMSPAGSDEAAQKEFEAKTPEQQIEMINHSPLPKAEKDKRIAEIKAKGAK